MRRKIRALIPTAEGLRMLPWLVSLQKIQLSALVQPCYATLML